MYRSTAREFPFPPLGVYLRVGWGLGGPFQLPPFLIQGALQGRFLVQRAPDRGIYSRIKKPTRESRSHPSAHSVTPSPARTLVAADVTTTAQTAKKVLTSNSVARVILSPSFSWAALRLTAPFPRCIDFIREWFWLGVG